MTTFLGEEIRVARKRHVCTWCGEKINKTQPYLYSKYVYAGDFFDEKLHYECHVAKDIYYMQYCGAEEDGYIEYDMVRGKAEER